MRYPSAEPCTSATTSRARNSSRARPARRGLVPSVRGQTPLRNRPSRREPIDMIQEHLPRGASRRAIEGSSALLPPPGGRAAAPWISRWLPALSKVGAAMLAAAVLAVVGAHAGSPSLPTDRVTSAAIAIPDPAEPAPPPPHRPSRSGAVAAESAPADAGADPGPA